MLTRAIVVLLSLMMLAAPVAAADNAIVVTPGTGVTIRSIDIGGGVQSGVVILGSTAGAAIYGTAGTSNANVISIQGIASGTAVPISGTVTVTGVATAANQATEIAGIGAIGDAAWTSGNGSIIAIAKTIANGVGAAIPTQAPTVSIGGVGIIDSAGTNVATVKAASTLPVATDKTLVVGLNPGTAVAGTPTGAILTVQGVASMTPFLATPLQGGTALSTTNGGFQNILQGNAVLSVSNPSFSRSVAGATGGGTLSSAIAPATPAGVNLKASAGGVFRVFATTIQATPVYIKFYNASSAPTCGSGTPVGRFMVPAAATAANGAGTNIDIGDMGAAFGTGIGYCVTGALADNDTTAITANNTLVNIVWN